MEDGIGTPTVNVEAGMKEKVVEEEVPVARKGTSLSITSDLAQKWSSERKQKEVDEDRYSIPYLFMRIGLLNREGLWRYVVGSVFAISELVFFACRSLLNPVFEQ